jgi:hypothetical protein
MKTNTVSGGIRSAKSLSQGQYRPKVSKPDKRQKIRDKHKD